MSLTEIMSELESLGTAQNRKTWARHGAPENQFGVSYAELYKLQKKIKCDHDLALALWATGNADARILATLIGDPNRMSFETLDQWLMDCNYYIINEAIARYIAAKVPNIREAAERWIESSHEWTSACGWTVLAVMAGTGSSEDGLADDYFSPLLDRIEAEVHSAPNRTRHAMNMALCSFGIYREGLRASVLQATGRIGKVVVDHGKTGCKTPDAASYILKAAQRRKGK